MKKVPLILFCAALVMLAFMVGFFLFRNQGSSIVRISDYTSPTVPTETLSYPIDINTADTAALMTIPGIGENYARSIVDHREKHGNFTSVEELLKIPGIGQKRLDAILEYITIGGSDEDTGC